MNDSNDSEGKLKKKLTEEEYHVTQEKGTEPPFENAYWNNKEKGMYRCKVCGESLFSSDKKYDSGTGWPSFDAPIDEKNVHMNEDSSHGMTRTEVVCKKCGAHLGHVFPDGPKETTCNRFCINSASLEFEKEEKK